MARDEALIQLLKSRDGILTVAIHRDGSQFVFANIAWGYDLGDEYAHITTNISPRIEGLSEDFFFTNELVDLVDYEDRFSLLSLPL